MLSQLIWRRSKARAANKSAGRRPSRRRLRFEALEGRAVLSGVSIYADWVAEGETISVHVALDAASDGTVAVDFNVGDNEMVANQMATAETDYFIEGMPGVYSGTITFPEGEFEHIFFIETVDDAAFEGVEWLSIQLSNAVNVELGQYYDDYTRDVWIEDPDDPYLVISNIEVLESLDCEETVYARFFVEMVGGSGGTSSEVTWTTMVSSEDTATSGSDFTASSGTVEAGNEILVPINFDGPGESPETFRVSLTSATGGITIMVAEAVATVYDAFAVAADGPPPDGQHGPTVGRTVSDLSSDKGSEFWEGDTVTFTPTYSNPTPAPTESIVWHRRALKKISGPSGQQQSFYGPWQVITSPYTFNEPFIGQVRMTLTSADTVSSKTIDVRAKAAHPTGLTVVTAARVGDHLGVEYTWASSSGRVADLDGVKIGEFYWWTDRGYWLGSTLILNYRFRGPAFDFQQPDGHYMPPGGIDATSLVMTDFHGKNTKLKAKRAYSTETVSQYYWYEISDGANYWNIVDHDYGEGIWWESQRHGDPVGKQRWEDRVVDYKVYRLGTDWKFEIDKRGDASLVTDIPSSGVWVAQ